MTVGTIFNDFKTRARDLVTPARYRDALLLLWYNDGVRDIYNFRPDLLETIVFEDGQPVEATATSDTFPYIDDGKQAMVLYLLYRAADYDADYKKADYMRKQYITELTG